MKHRKATREGDASAEDPAQRPNTSIVENAPKLVHNAGWAHVPRQVVIEVTDADSDCAWKGFVAFRTLICLGGGFEAFLFCDHSSHDSSVQHCS